MQFLPTSLGKLAAWLARSPINSSRGIGCLIQASLFSLDQCRCEASHCRNVRLLLRPNTWCLSSRDVLRLFATSELLGDSWWFCQESLSPTGYNPAHYLDE